MDSLRLLLPLPRLLLRAFSTEIAWYFPFPVIPHDLVGDRVAWSQPCTRRQDGNVHKNIVASVFWCDEAKTLFLEPVLQDTGQNVRVLF